MKTDTQKKLKAESSNNMSTADSGSTESKGTMKVVRKSLHPLQIAAGDKENLVGAGRMISIAGEKDLKGLVINSKPTNSSISPKKENKKSNKNQEKKTVTVEDLTTEEGPSEHYWQVLAETRRKALQKVLEENEQIHKQLRELQEENNKYKELLEEAQAIVDTLNEVISEMNSDGDVADDNIRRP